MKEFCDELTEEQLDKKVILWREDEAISKIEPITLSEDYYMFDGDEGCVPESEAKHTIKHESKEYPNGLADVEKGYEKGHPILMEDF